MAKPVYTNQQVINQIDSGWHWTSGGSTATSVTFGITTSNSWYSSVMPEYAGWLALNAKQTDSAYTAMELWTDLIDVDITAAADPNAADIRFSNSTTGVSYAHAYYPGATNSDFSVNQLAQGSIWLNPAYTSLNDPDVSEYGFMAIMHEVGHTLGLSHPGTYNGGSPNYTDDAIYAQDTHQFTIMSYFAANQTNSDWWAGNGVWQWAQTPMLHDILAIQAIYGADLTTRSDDTTYGFNSTAGNTIYDFTMNLDPVLTIWDGDGEDTLDFSGWNTNSVISLVEGEFSNVNSMTQNIAIAFGAKIENAIGGSGDDLLTGNSLDNVLDGGAGNDTASFAGALGAMVVNLSGMIVSGLGIGVDTLISIENAIAGPGNDTIYGTSGRNDLFGGTGSDQISGLGNDDIVYGEDGNDTLLGGSGSDTMFGGDGVDLLNGQGGDDELHGGVNGDQLFGDTGNDLLFGDAQNDIIKGHTGNDTLNGGDDADFMFGEDDDDLLNGDGGDDVLLGGSGIDMVNGGIGNDTLFGQEGNDILNGGTGDDILAGGSDDDLLNGDNDDDRLFGQSGNDTLNGGAGDDDLAGGANHDIFQFDANWNHDTILDWANGINTIDLSSLNTNIGALTIEDFNAGADTRIFITADGSAANTIILSNIDHNTIAGVDFAFV